MNELIAKITESTHRAAFKLNVKSALNPVLWLCAIVLPVCFLFAWVFKDISIIRTLLIIVGIAPVVVACFAYIGFAIFCPDKLQSEDYQLRHETLQLIQQKSGRISIPPTSIEAITNPKANVLNSKESANDA